MTAALLALLGVALIAPPAQARDERIRTIPGRADVTQSFVLVRPAGAPAATVVLFTGGRGALALERGLPGPRATNFLVRNRRQFAERGLLVAVLDAPSDRKAEALVGFRTTPDHAADVRALITALRAEAPVPVWLVGTSMGSVSAAAVAARLGRDGPDGIVLTSSVTRRSRQMSESLNDVALEAIRVPVLVVHHRHDGCPASPYADTAWLMRTLSASPRRELLSYAGGDAPKSDPCEPLSPHGYFGFDAKVLDAIVAWMAATPAERNR